MTREGAIGNLIHAIRWNDMPKKEALDMAIQALKQEPKTGHWIEVIDEVNEYGNKTYHHECSECGSNKSGWGEYDYCPNCGAKMVEPQESEVQDADND